MEGLSEASQILLETKEVDFSIRSIICIYMNLTSFNSR